MASCLGIYVGKNIIKYAKIDKNGDEVKLGAFGFKIYTSNVKEAIDQIISETDSASVPISTSINGEKYNYFYTSSLLNRNDLNKALETEFESVCYDKGENPKNYISKYILLQDEENKNRLNAIYVSAEKGIVSGALANFQGKNVSTVSTLPVALSGLATIGVGGEFALLNIDDETTLSIVKNGKISAVKDLDVRASNILDTIAAKTNSYTKAYEICKNTTIYTMQNQDMLEETNEYLADIVPVLFEIGTQMKEYFKKEELNPERIFITGLGAVINNIELYFNEIIDQEKCEVLKPYFLQDEVQINIKDGIEVNSAIALAFQGVGLGNKDINFAKKQSGVDLRSILFKEINVSKKKKKPVEEKEKKNILTMNVDLSNVFGNVTGAVKYCFVGVLIMFLSYVIITSYISNEIKLKERQIDDVAADTNTQISKISKDTDALNRKTTEYKDLTTNLKKAKESLIEKNSYKYSIPTLMSQLSVYIPKAVRLTSIENPSDKKIIIYAESEYYEQLAYFKAKLKLEGILESVVSTQATKDDKVVKIAIEGELP